MPSGSVEVTAEEMWRESGGREGRRREVVEKSLCVGGMGR